MIKKPIYLDYHATTPIDPRVYEAMQPYFMEHFGNAGSRTHEYGTTAEKAVENARAHVAKLINACSSLEIIFTSGATEANNIAIQGYALEMKEQGKNHIITNSIEHKAVLDVCKDLETRGFSVTYLVPREDGTLNLDTLEKAITPATGLISIMHANNEIGVINFVKKIGEIAKQHGILFHCDAAQSFGKIAIDVQEMNIHLLSISGHKIYGPKGIGALYLRKQNPQVLLKRIIFGGGQERGYRSGTLAVPLIVGLGKAAQLALKEMKKDINHAASLRERLLAKLKESISNFKINGSMDFRLPNNLNASFLGVDSEALMMNLRSDLAVSNGSACTSTDWKSSYVLRALGIDESRAKSAIRFGLGRFTTKEEIDYAVECISENVKNLRGMLSETTSSENMSY